MPIDDSYRALALRKVWEFGKRAEERLKTAISELEEEDLELGLSVVLKDDNLSELWQKCIENNIYMEVGFTEIMEHHDGAYLKATFRNSEGPYTAERYVSIRSSGRVETSHAFFLKIDRLTFRMEKEVNGSFRVFVRSL